MEKDLFVPKIMPVERELFADTVPYLVFAINSGRMVYAPERAC